MADSLSFGNETWQQDGRDSDRDIWINKMPSVFAMLGGQQSLKALYLVPDLIHVLNVCSYLGPTTSQSTFRIKIAGRINGETKTRDALSMEDKEGSAKRRRISRHGRGVKPMS